MEHLNVMQVVPWRGLWFRGTGRTRENPAGLRVVTSPGDVTQGQQTIRYPCTNDTTVCQALNRSAGVSGFPETP